MNFQIFKSKLNWRQILIHSIASFFFIFSFKTFAYLNDTTFLAGMRLYNQGEKVKGVDTLKHSSNSFNNFLLITLYSVIVGLFIAFVISLFISLKRKWFWLNSLITFLITYLLYRFDLIGWKYLHKIFFYFGQLFNNINVELLINGTIMLIFGLSFFFLQPFVLFIENKNKSI